MRIRRLKGEILMRAEKIASTKEFEEQLSALVRNARLNTVKLDIRKRSWIYHCGDRNANLYLIETGLVKIVLYAETGKECVLSVHGRDGVFGEMCFAQEERME